MATATFIKTMDDYRGVACLYKLNPPMRATKYDWDNDGEEIQVSHEFVIVSAILNSFAHETFIFPSNEVGEIVDYGELPGSYTGGTNHAKALGNAGYSVV